MDCDNFVLSIRTQNIINDLKNLEDLFDFSSLDVNHEIFGTENEKLIGEIKKEAPKNIWIDELLAWRSKACSFKCKDRNTNLSKVISKSQSKIFNFVQ